MNHPDILDRIFYYLSLIESNSGNIIGNYHMVNRQWYQAALPYLSYVLCIQQSRHSSSLQHLTEKIACLNVSSGQSITTLIIDMTFLSSQKHDHHHHQRPDPSPQQVTSSPSTISPFVSLLSSSPLTKWMKMGDKSVKRKSSLASTLSSFKQLQYRRNRRNTLDASLTSELSPSYSSWTSTRLSLPSSTSSTASTDTESSSTHLENTPLCCEECLQLYDLVDKLVEVMVHCHTHVRALVLDFHHCSFSSYYHHQAPSFHQPLRYFFTQLIRHQVTLPRLDRLTMQNLPRLGYNKDITTTCSPFWRWWWCWLETLSPPRYLSVRHCTSALLQDEFQKLIQHWIDDSNADLNLRHIRLHGIMLQHHHHHEHVLLPQLLLPASLHHLEFIACDPEWFLSPFLWTAIQQQCPHLKTFLINHRHDARTATMSYYRQWRRKQSRQLIDDHQVLIRGMAGILRHCTELSRWLIQVAIDANNNDDADADEETLDEAIKNQILALTHSKVTPSTVLAHTRDQTTWQHHVNDLVTLPPPSHHCYL